ncbi:putative kelch repeat and BTB domain-containing protein 7 [Triplophysa rosa]|uniref:Kelch repeat and BTB domain-containing protein 7 n=1 Tax=Triplophysa rosa TaxID=992332 RepID=A0A9W7T2K3_TRIRA|nr:putative kelch repeat and BTB domain-containing protein 7 [Triplophysa rosa]
MATMDCFVGPEELEDTNHAVNLMKELKLFYESQLLVDVSIECNRNILAASSPYFRSMFTGGLYESTQKKITIYDVDADLMAVIIDYCYTGKVTITERNVQRLYAAANMLQMEYIRQVCANFMTSRLDLSNCVGILKFADTFDNLELKKKAQLFIAKNLVPFSANVRDFCELDLKQMKDILSLDSLDVDCERKVCSFAIQWIENNQHAAAEDALQILRCVRWSLFSEKDSPFIYRYLSSMLDEAVGEQSSMISKGLIVTKHRIGNSAKEVVLFFGQPNEPFMCYDPYTEDICSVASPTINLTNQNFKRSPMETFLACTTPEDNLYLASHLSKHLWVYNPLLNCWQELAERLLGRMHSYMGYLNGHLYILGGRDPISDARLKEVECYSIQRNQWIFVAPLPHSLLCVMNKRRMLSYEPKKNHWLQRGSLKCSKLHKACVFQEQIICLCDIPVVKAYNPSCGEWRRIRDIPIDSINHNKNRLVIHEYDATQDNWTIVTTMFGSSFGFVSLSTNFVSEEDNDSGSSADWDFDGLTDADSDSGSSSSFSDENW